MINLIEDSSANWYLLNSENMLQPAQEVDWRMSVHIQEDAEAEVVGEDVEALKYLEKVSEGVQSSVLLIANNRA